MMRQLLRGKIHRATVTDANLDYVGSITIDQGLMEAAGIVENEKVMVVNINNGERFETYVLMGQRDSGMICLNGAAARLAQVNDLIIVMSYAFYDEEEVRTHQPRLLQVNSRNEIIVAERVLS